VANFVITNCTNRKRSEALPVTPRTLTDRSIESLARTWVEQTRGAKSLSPATSLYVGRPVVDAKFVCSVCSAEFLVVSAGLGLVSGACFVPNYQLTVVDGVGSIRPWLVRNNYLPEDWWTALNNAFGKRNPISSLINVSNVDDIFLIALPSTYVELIANDLSLVQVDKANRVRIFHQWLGWNCCLSICRLRLCHTTTDSRVCAITLGRGLTLRNAPCDILSRNCKGML